MQKTTKSSLCDDDISSPRFDSSLLYISVYHPVNWTNIMPKFLSGTLHAGAIMWRPQSVITGPCWFIFIFVSLLLYLSGFLREWKPNM